MNCVNVIDCKSCMKGCAEDLVLHGYCTPCAQKKFPTARKELMKTVIMLEAWAMSDTFLDVSVRGRQAGIGISKECWDEFNNDMDDSMVALESWGKSNPCETCTIVTEAMKDSGDTAICEACPL